MTVKVQTVQMCSAYEELVFPLDGGGVGLDIPFSLQIKQDQGIVFEQQNALHRQWFPKDQVKAGERGLVKVKEQGLPGIIRVPSQKPGTFCAVSSCDFL